MNSALLCFAVVLLAAAVLLVGMFSEKQGMLTAFDQIERACLIDQRIEINGNVFTCQLERAAPTPQQGEPQ